MLRTIPIRPGDRRIENHFIELPFRLYEGCPYWVPPFKREVRKVIRRNHPFFAHADGEFFLTERDGRPVSRIAVFENRAHSEYHGTREANFYFFDCENDDEAAQRTFRAALDWARHRGLDSLFGPTFSGGAGAVGVLVEGFTERSAMTMMPYNFAYYRSLYEANGFEKRLDLLSARIDPRQFVLPERVQKIARMVLDRGRLWVKEFSSKRDLREFIEPIASLYNETLVNNAENYPLTDAELDAVASDLLFVADPKLIKILMHGDEVVGFLFAFPDLSRALQRAGGTLNPFSLVDILLEFKRTRHLIINGAGIHPDHQKMGGNALLYHVLDKTCRQKEYVHADITQVAETTELMLSDLQSLGAEVYKRHRIYTRTV